MDVNWWYVLALCIASTIAFYAYAVWEAGYFKRRGIKNLPFDFPIVGNMYKAMIAFQEHFIDTADRLYNAFPNEKYVGIMQINKPTLFLRDLDIIKQITIKDFDHFVDHEGVINEHADPLFGNILFSLTGSKWRDMRATLSPAFTSSKMKVMFSLVDEIAQQMTKFYLEKLKEPEWKERGLIEVEMKDAFTRYANDVIASSAFGLTVNSLEERNNEFYEMGKKASDFSGFQILKFFLFSAFPKLMKLTGLKIFGNDVKKFFTTLVLDTMKIREKKGIVRPDMIQLLMEAKKGSLKYDTSQIEVNDAGFATVGESNVGKQIVKREWTDIEIVAQALLFFIAGFETSSTLLCFATHELTINPEAQKKLQDEIDELIAEKGETLTYNDLMKMKYMDMVISETLRLWPPVVILDRECVRPYTLPSPNENSKLGHTMYPRDVAWIPVAAIHHDPQYYPNPKKFEPERFSDENKSNINPSAYLPFGTGPRNCIGSRFALMEAKAILFHLLAKFDFVSTAKTENPIKLNNKTFNLHALNGFWVGLKPRN